ncbi:MAG: MotA/TolQ/ExbB proton channel family protein [Thermodesulfobacteriota bacterium]|nr:MotA/TolQ/ExbB proton channel family protein [Thermodesulfobacteriota bacterium]
MLKKIIHTGLLVFGITISSGFTQPLDMRADFIEAEKQKQALVEKARQEAALAEKDAKLRHMSIVSDRSALLKAIDDLKNRNAHLEKDIYSAQAHLQQLAEKEQKIKAALLETEAVNKELSGFVKGYAKDLDTLFRQSPQSALESERDAFLKALINQTRFPSMDDIHHMVDSLFDEIRLSGSVRLINTMIVDRKGRESQAEVLVLGNFTAVYMLGKETGFLLYSDKSNRLFALSKLPKSRISKQNRSYMKGNADGVYLDILKGGALRQMMHELSLTEQIPKGGPIVWPILVIFAIAILIIIERILFLRRKSLDEETFTRDLCLHLANGETDQCFLMCEENIDKSIPRIMKAGIECREMDRVDMENALQESILSEIPKLERFLSTLGMLAAISPLLGLLGTVTGMINTFHVITYYGTGDPRMMSGGISEALVTTMLGLIVAIPIMLAHTLLSRKVENMIGKMEEKAVAFVNTIYKTK